MGCPIRRSRDQGSCAPPPGLSQLITSFFAFESQGIRLLPFPTSFFLFVPCSSAAKDGGLRTCSIKLRVFSILRLSDLDLICPSPCGGRRLYLLYYLKLFSICQRSSIRANRRGCLQLRTAVFHLASLDLSVQELTNSEHQGELAMLYRPVLITASVLDVRVLQPSLAAAQTPL